MGCTRLRIWLIVALATVLALAGTAAGAAPAARLALIVGDLPAGQSSG